MTHDPAAAAAIDAPSVVELLRQLVSAPSRGGVDDYRAVVDVVTGWQEQAGLSPRVLTGAGGTPVAVVVDVHGHRPGRHVVLDACLDTAGLGDESAWTVPPFAGEVIDGWLYGRGAADSKAAAAVFSHIAARLAAQREAITGTVTVLLDLDEHTGGFAGIRRYLEQARPDAVMIGYPGPEQIVVGGRGVARARITMYGPSGHSGSSRPSGPTAIARATALVQALAAAPAGVDPALGLPPKVTVTSIVGGQPGQYSVLPGRCEVEVDVRLTTTLAAAAAWEWLRDVVAQVDVDLPAPRPSLVEQAMQPWPAFRLPDGHELVTALQAGARDAGLDPVPVVAGPSNIGCLLSSLGIPATAGFGALYQGLHGVDEAVEVASLPAVQAAYHGAVLRLLAPERVAAGVHAAEASEGV